MKIDLEYPYNEIYKAGYLRVNRENRNTLYLVKHEGIHTSSSTSYSRYLMAVHLKRFLTEDEQVDHIDNDKSNDIIENLQILSMKENLSKSKRPRAMTTLICDGCGITFTKPSNQVHNSKFKYHSRACMHTNHPYK